MRQPLAKLMAAKPVLSIQKGYFKLSRGYAAKLLRVLGLACALFAVFMALTGLKDVELKVGNWLYLLTAVLCSAVGFLSQGLAWGMSVKVVHKNYLLSDALLHHCITIFTKYIPGKILAVFSRAWLASKSLNVGPGSLSLVSLLDVIFSTALGLLVGCFLLLFDEHLGDKIRGSIAYGAVLIGVLVTLASLFLFRRFFVRLNKKFVIMSAFSLVCCWFSWALGFSLLMASFEGLSFDLSNGSIFVVSVCLSLFIAVLPGGIGIREGFLMAGLMFNGFSHYESASFALLARLWFLFGECIVYLLSVYYERRIFGRKLPHR